MEASWGSQSVGFPQLYALDITELEELTVKTKRNLILKPITFLFLEQLKTTCF